MRSAIKIIRYGSLLILITLITILYLLLGTTEGLQYGIRYFVPLYLDKGTVTIEHLQGSVLSGVSFTHIYYKTNDTQWDLSGSIYQQWAIQWKATIPLLNATATGDMTGPLFTPQVRGSLEAPQLTLANQKIERVRARIQGHFNLQHHTGLLELDQGDMTLPGLGIHPTNITIKADIHNDEAILTGSVKSNGVLTITGKKNTDTPFSPTELTLTGKNINVLHQQKMGLVVSPNLTMQLNYPHLACQGTITIPKATMKMKEIMSFQRLPDEVVFVGEAAPQKNTPLEMDLHVKIHLGDDIFFSYQDFKSYLGGDLLITQSPGRAAVGTGEINAVHGKYALYGQALAIKKARLIYTGSLLSNPGLDIEATRASRTGGDNPSGGTQAPLLNSFSNDAFIVGIRITGTADHPDIQFFSNPPGMSQNDIISALGGASIALFGALSVLHPATSSLVDTTSKLTKKLGLTEINIAPVQTFNPTTSQSESTQSFIVGKKITDKISVHYSVGIFNPVSILNVRYDINKHWAVQSENSTIDNGADVFYEFHVKK